MLNLTFSSCVDIPAQIAAVVVVVVVIVFVVVVVVVVGPRQPETQPPPPPTTTTGSLATTLSRITQSCGSKLPAHLQPTQST